MTIFLVESVPYATFLVFKTFGTIPSHRLNLIPQFNRRSKSPSNKSDNQPRSLPILSSYFSYRKCRYRCSPDSRLLDGHRRIPLQWSQEPDKCNHRERVNP